MKARLWQWSLGCLMGAVIAGGLYPLLSLVRQRGDFAAVFADSEPWLMAAVVGAFAGGLTALLVARLNRRPIVQVVQAPPPTPAPPPPLPVPAVVSPSRAKQRQAPFLARMQVARLSLDLRWEKVSRLMQKLLGVSGKKLRGVSMLQRIHEEDRIVIERRFLNPSKVAFEAKFRLLPRAKKKRDAKAPTISYVQLTAAPLRDAQGKVCAWRCLFIDVTRQVLAENANQTQTAALAQAQTKWQRVERQFERLKESYFDLYHQSPVMCFSLDAEGRFVTFNDKLLQTLDYQRDQLLGRKYADIVTMKGTTPESFELPSEKVGEWETQWRRKDGKLLDVWMKTVAVLDEQGKPARWRNYALDNTERNQLANDLRTHTEELERTNSRLRHINSELEDFTHVVSHDLKEPLRTLQMYSSLLAEDFSSQLSTDGFQYINHLVQASKRLGQLIDDLLNLSQAGRASRAPKAFNLIEVVATVRRDLVDMIQRKEATLLTEGKLPAVSGDPQRITQLLTNLVANGLKYNKNAAPCVTIGQKLEGADDRQVIIFVRDNGIGIDPKHHQQIFGLFRRVNDQKEFEGTGAGLAICKKIVEAHGGRIWVVSTPGQGSTFNFTLPKPMPAALRNGRPSGMPASPPANVSSAPQSEPGKHILLVEDHPDYGMIIQKLGQRAGLKITWFTTAEEAWDWLQEGRPDFLLVDIKLPGMNGMELCRRIHTELPIDAPIALFSGDQQPDDLEKLREIGVDYFLSKDLLSNHSHWQKKLGEVLAGERRREVVAT